MKIVNPISANILQLLEHYETNGHLNMQASLIGERSVLYKLANYSLKVYTDRGKLDGEMECDAMMSMQHLRHVPKVYAYAPGQFVLTDWVEGLSLKEYNRTLGKWPENLLHDLLQAEFEQIQAGYQDWEVIQYEHLRWTCTGEVTRMEFWLCEPIGAGQSSVMQQFLNKIKRIHANDLRDLDTIMLYLQRHGLTQADISCALDQFRIQQNGSFCDTEIRNG